MRISKQDFESLPDWWEDNWLWVEQSDRDIVVREMLNGQWYLYGPKRELAHTEFNRRRRALAELNRRESDSVAA